MGEGACADTIPWPSLVKSASEVCQRGVIQGTEEKLVIPPSPGRARQACPCACDSSSAAQPGSGGDPGSRHSSPWAMLVSRGLVRLSQRRDHSARARGALGVSLKGLRSRLTPARSPARPPRWAAQRLVPRAWRSRLFLPLHGQRLLCRAGQCLGLHGVSFLQLQASCFWLCLSLLFYFYLLLVD